MTEAAWPVVREKVMALSLRSPWWWFILHSTKRIENRSWATRYRGPILIHASRWWNARDVAENFAAGREMAIESGHLPPGPVTLRDLKQKSGLLVGRAVVVDCVTASASPWFMGPYGFVLDEVESLAAALPCTGALGFFDAGPALRQAGES